ncbi:MAG TPA: hypothetical protein VM140_04305 [Burkholderiales bacterium]|nr:hypothetical protein [Burkholderiales bacterium]
MTTALRLLALLAALGMLADSASAARRTVIQDLEGVSVTGKDYAPLSAAQMKTVISEAATSLGWKIIESTDEKLRLELTGGKYSVTIDLPYDEKGYGLRYVESRGLLYNNNGKWRGIHSSYKRWVDNLVRAIGQSALGELPPPAAKIAEEKLD